VGQTPDSASRARRSSARADPWPWPGWWTPAARGRQPATGLVFSAGLSWVRGQRLDRLSALPQPITRHLCSTTCACWESRLWLWPAEL